MYRAGVDVGGTFTDVVLVDEKTGNVHTSKVLNRSANPAAAVVAGLQRALDDAKAQTGELRFISHGTTITTNAVIERKGAVTALIGNTGFRDILEIARFSRPAELIYRVHEDKPAPLVPRRRRLELACRVDSRGRIITDPDAADILRLADDLERESVEAVAICFLFSFLAPAHEQFVAETLTELLPAVAVICSSDIMPEMREFPRTSTTVFAAYVAPVLRRYLDTLVLQLKASEMHCPLYIFQSNGGVADPRIVSKNPAKTLLSGPAGAVAGAAALCRQAGIKDLISMDIGGTSLDVCLVREGEAELTTQREIDHFPVVTPMLDVHTIGAGGGSVVALDEVGRVKIGPLSMGAHPGPACYGLGGEAATLTDVNLILGYLDPANFAGGEIILHPENAKTALARSVAGPLGLDVYEAALGVYRVASNQIAEAIRFISVEKGYDARDFALLSFGGGGALHAAAVAAEMGIKTVIVPRHPGLFSAHGIAVADFMHDYSLPVLRTAEEQHGAEIQDAFSQLARRAETDLNAEGIGADLRRFKYGLDMRYQGQTTEITVAVNTPLQAAQAGWIEAVSDAFHARHKQLYSYAVPGEPVEIIHARLKAQGIVVVKKPTPISTQTAAQTSRKVRQRSVWFAGYSEPIETPVFERAGLRPGSKLSGPAIIEETSSTSVLPPEVTAYVDARENLILNLENPQSQ